MRPEQLQEMVEELGNILTGLCVSGGDKHADECACHLCTAYMCVFVARNNLEAELEDQQE